MKRELRDAVRELEAGFTGQGFVLVSVRADGSACVVTSLTDDDDVTLLRRALLTVERHRSRRASPVH